MDDGMSRTVSKRRRLNLAVQGRAARSTHIRQLRCRCPLLDGITRNACRVIRPRVSRLRKLSPGADPRGARCGRLFGLAEALEIGIACGWGLAHSEPATAEDFAVRLR